MINVDVGIIEKLQIQFCVIKLFQSYEIWTIGKNQTTFNIGLNLKELIFDVEHCGKEENLQEDINHLTQN